MKIIFIVTASLLIIRMILPSLIKVGVNDYLDDFSPSLKGKVEDIDLKILRGQYVLNNLTLDFKMPDKEFLSVETIDLDIPWKDIIRGRTSINILLTKLDFNFSKEFVPAIKKHVASMSKSDKKPTITINRLDIEDSLIRTSEFPTLTKDENILLSSLNLRASNIGKNPEAPLTPLTLRALVLGSGKLKIEGDLNLVGEAPQWSLDGEMLNFNLTTLNKFLKKKVPLTFTRGELDLYTEAKKENGPIIGYMKPFIKGLDVIQTDEKFKGPKHWLIEVVTGLGNLTLRSDETAATRIPFSFGDSFEIDGGATLAKAVSHGLIKEQSRGIENSIDLKVKQAQEEK